MKLFLDHGDAVQLDRDATGWTGVVDIDDVRHVVHLTMTPTGRPGHHPGEGPTPLDPRTTPLGEQGKR